MLFCNLDQFLDGENQMEEEIQIENIDFIKNEAIIDSNPSQIKEEENNHEDNWAANILNKSETYLKIMRRRPIHMSSSSSLSDT